MAIIKYITACKISICKVSSRTVKTSSLLRTRYRNITRLYHRLKENVKYCVGLVADTTVGTTVPGLSLSGSGSIASPCRLGVGGVGSSARGLVGLSGGGDLGGCGLLGLSASGLCDGRDHDGSSVALSVGISNGLAALAVVSALATGSNGVGSTRAPVADSDIHGHGGGRRTGLGAMTTTGSRGDSGLGRGSGSGSRGGSQDSGGGVAGGSLIGRSSHPGAIVGSATFGVDWGGTGLEGRLGNGVGDG